MGVSTLTTMMNWLGSSLILPPLNMKSNVMKICWASGIPSLVKIASFTVDEYGSIVNDCTVDEPRYPDW